MSRFSRTAALTLGVIAVLAVGFVPSAMADQHRLRVAIDEPFMVNGYTFAPGQLLLRQLGDYNPIATLNEIWVGNHCLGVLLAREVPGATASDHDSMILVRNGDGLLVLVGVAFRGEPARDLFASDQYADRGRRAAPDVTAMLTSN